MDRYEPTFTEKLAQYAKQLTTEAPINAARLACFNGDLAAIMALDPINNHHLFTSMEDAPTEGVPLAAFGMACAMGHLNVVQLGLEHWRGGLEQAAMVACYSGQLAVIQAIMPCLHLSDPESHPSLFALLSIAASGGQIHILDYLMGLKIPLGPQVERSYAPAVEAYTRGHLAAVEYLLAHGISVNARDSSGETLLWLACLGIDYDKFPTLSAGGDPRMIRMLLSHPECNPNIACISYNLPIMQLYRLHGPKVSMEAWKLLIMDPRLKLTDEPGKPPMWFFSYIAPNPDEAWLKIALACRGLPPGVQHRDQLSPEFHLEPGLKAKSASKTWLTDLGKPKGLLTEYIQDPIGVVHRLRQDEIVGRDLLARIWALMLCLEMGLCAIKPPSPPAEQTDGLQNGATGDGPAAHRFWKCCQPLSRQLRMLVASKMYRVPPPTRQMMRDATIWVKAIPLGPQELVIDGGGTPSDDEDDGDSTASSDASGTAMLSDNDENSADGDAALDGGDDGW